MHGFDGTSLSILIVDDNADIAESLAFLFRCWHHEVRIAHDGPGALAVARAFQPQVVVLDIGLPGMDGFEAARQLRAQPEFRQTFLVAASGYNQEKDRRRAREVGIDLYLVKPFDPWRLEALFATRRETAVPA